MFKIRKTPALAGATAALVLTATPITANAFLSDNVHNLAGGGANIHTEDQCVENVGDKAHVKYMAQHQPLVTSSDKGQTSASGTLAIPANMENVKIKIKAVGFVGDDDDDDDGIQAKVFDNPIDVPVEDTKFGENNDKPGPRNFMMVYNDDGESIGAEKSVKQNIKDGAKMVKHHMADGDSGNFPFSTQNNSAPVWYGDNTKDYDFYEFGNLFSPITFEVEGDINTTGEDTFATAAISNLGWKASQNETAGSYANGDQSLTEYAQFRVGALPPALPEDDHMIDAFKEGISDAGLDISPAIAPTSEVSGDAKYRMIGHDIRPSSRGDVGDSYTRAFTLHDNKAVTYAGQVPLSGEDGADITAAHVSICNHNEEESTDSEEATTEQTSTNQDSMTENGNNAGKDTSTTEERSPREEKDDTPATSTEKGDTPATSTEDTPTENTTTTPTSQAPQGDNINATTKTQQNTPTPAPNGNGGNGGTGSQNHSNNNGNSALPTTGADLYWAGITAAVAALAGGVLLISARKKKA